MSEVVSAEMSVLGDTAAGMISEASKPGECSHCYHEPEGAVRVC